LILPTHSGGPRRSSSSGKRKIFCSRIKSQTSAKCVVPLANSKALRGRNLRRSASRGTRRPRFGFPEALERDGRHLRIPKSHALHHAWSVIIGRDSVVQTRTAKGHAATKLCSR
jgi:hypothetical protein